MDRTGSAFLKNCPPWLEVDVSTRDHLKIRWEKKNHLKGKEGKMRMVGVGGANRDGKVSDTQLLQV